MGVHAVIVRVTARNELGMQRSDDVRVTCRGRISAAAEHWNSWAEQVVWCSLASRPSCRPYYTPTSSECRAGADVKSQMLGHAGQNEQ